jgi:hypothetical protein
MSLILIFTWEEKEKKFFFSVLLFVSFERDWAWEHYTMHIARHVMRRRRSRDGQTILTFSFFVCVFVKNVVVLVGVLPHRQL